MGLAIEKALKDLDISIPGDIIQAEKIESTNSLLLDKINSGLPSGSVVVSDNQTKGRGRMNREWVSHPQSSIALSYYHHFDDPNITLSGLSLAIGVAVAKAIQQLGIPKVGLKWPNDIVYNRKKLGGILIESIRDAKGTFKVVIGIGVNCDFTEQQIREIDQPVISLRQILGRRCDLNQVAAHIIKETQTALSTYTQQGLSAFVSDWRSMDSLSGCPVIVCRNQHMQTGVVQGIDEQGGLKLDNAGEVTVFYGSDVSIRAI